MKKAKILVVEDEAVIAKELQLRLQNKGYDVPCISMTGEDAINKAREINPDLLLMDITLIGSMDGIEAARQIRLKRDIPVIYLSAYTDKILSERAKETGPFGYLSKPFSDYDLLNTIEMALYKHNAEKALRQEKEFTEKAINSQIDTFFVFNPVTGKAIRWNNKFRDISGYTDDEIADLKAPDSYYSPEDLQNAAATTEEIISKGQGKVEMSLICKDGRRVLNEYIASPIKDEEGNLKYIISIGRDITERKMAEKKVNALKADIETYTNHAISASEKGDEALAIECAEHVADHEANLETEQSLLDGYLSSEASLKDNIAKAKTSVRRMEQQIDQVKATESVQKAQVAVSTRHMGANSKVKTALDSLERIKAKQEQRNAELAAADERANEENDTSLDAKLKAAGIQPGAQVRGNDKLAQILAAKKG